MERFEDLENENEKLQNELAEKYSEIDNLAIQKSREIDEINKKYEENLDILTGERNAIILKKRKVEDKIKNYAKNRKLEYLQSINDKYIITKLNFGNPEHTYRDELIILKIHKLNIEEESIKCDYTKFYYYIDRHLKPCSGIGNSSDSTYWESSTDWNDLYTPIYELNSDGFEKLMLQLQTNITTYYVTGKFKSLEEILQNYGIDTSKLDLRTSEQKAQDELKKC